jgi:diguanylate cyclase (GGDEF)-like protein
LRHEESTLMKRLARLSLEALLAWGFGTLVVGTAFAALLAFAVWRFADVAFDDYENLHAPVAMHASNGVDAWLEVRRHEETFLVAVENSHDAVQARSRYFRQWEDDVDKVRAYLKEVRRISGDSDAEIVAVLADLEAALAGYATSYTAVVDTMVRTQTAGGDTEQVESELRSLRGEFMESAELVEVGLERLEQAALENTHESLKGVEGRITDMALFSALLALVTVAVGATVALFVGARIREATRRIIGFAARVAAGRLETRLHSADSGQFGRLESALNTMADRLQQSDELMNQQARELEASNQRIALLSEMTGLLQSAVSMEEATQIAARHLARMNPSGGGALYLYDESRKFLRAIARWGNAAAIEGFPAADCWAMRRGQPYGSEEGDAALVCPHAVEARGHEPYLCLPMVTQEGVSGLLYTVFAPGDAASHDDEAHFARRLSEQLGLALANLRLRLTLREQSMHDALTGLYNRRFLDESVARECARALRDKQSLAVLMIDADHFKRFNDVHGHQAGDEALRQIGSVLVGNCRAGDLACRFGGEEFTVVLPRTGRDGAQVWAERLLQKMRQSGIQAQGKMLPPVTVSIGMALFPEHGGDANAVLHAADLALYEAKNAGRDRFVAR